MSSRSSRYTCFTRYPWMSIPRICPATERASSSESAGLIPPALPRPPTRTCALTMQGSGGSTTSSGLEAVTPRGIGMPYRAKISFALCSRNFTRDRSRPRGDDRQVAVDEEVLRSGIRHITVNVEHQDLVGAVLVRIEPGHDVVQVVQRLDRRAQALARHATVRGGHHLQAPLVHHAVQRE